MLFLYILYAAASVRKYNASERYKASQSIRSGQRLSENFMRMRGRRAQDTKIESVQNILDLQYIEAASMKVEFKNCVKTYTNKSRKGPRTLVLKRFTTLIPFSHHTSSQFCKARRFGRVAPAIFKYYNPSVDPQT